LPIAIISATGIFDLTSMKSMIVKAKISYDFDVMALAPQYLPVDNKLLDSANGNDGVDPKSDESKSSKNEHFTYNSRQFWIFQYIF
jgi:hypothetical protein